MAMLAEEKLARETQDKLNHENLENFKKEHKTEIANLTAEYEKKLKEMEEKHSAEISQIKTQMDTMDKRHLEEMEKLRSDMKKMEDNYKEAISKVRADLE